MNGLLRRRPERRIIEAHIEPIRAPRLRVFSRLMLLLGGREIPLIQGGSKSDVCENSLLLLLFNNTNFANVGDATGLRGSTTAGSFYLSLHTADPGETGTATTSEAAYTGYARVPVARSGAGFVVTNNSVSPAANADFGECTASAGSPITFFGVVTSASGAGTLMYSGTVSPNVTMAVGVIPRLKSTSTITED
jgi:hypothetical protein